MRQLKRKIAPAQKIMNSADQIFYQIIDRTHASPSGKENQYSGLCPAHDDQSPSLSITKKVLKYYYYPRSDTKRKNYLKIYLIKALLTQTKNFILKKSINMCKHFISLKNVK